MAKPGGRLKLEDLPAHIRAQYEHQWGVEAAQVMQWHIEITLVNGRICATKPTTEKKEVDREYNRLVKTKGSRNIKIVESFKE